MPLWNKVRHFFSALQNSPELDLRDIRGKKHDLSYVLLGLMLALFRSRDGNLSSMHRSMTNMNIALYTHLNLPPVKVISRSHLPVLLKKVNLTVFEQLLFSFFSITLSCSQKQWFAVDGKEIRGSIEKGSKRGEVLVHAFEHEKQQSVGQRFYNGKKQSERDCVHNLLSVNNLSSQKISLDALHLIPKTVNQIQKAGGVYLIGLKENQQELLADMQTYSNQFRASSQYTELDKGHGRIENREYQTFDIAHQYVDARWKQAGFKTLVKVEREVYDCKKQTNYQETAFYLSNQKVANSQDFELAKAVRKHWAIETNHHKRDVTLKEDELRTKQTKVTQLLAGCRTFVLNLLAELKPKNTRATLERFADCFDELIQWLRLSNVL